MLNQKTICYPLAIYQSGGTILKVFLNCATDDGPRIVFLDRSGEVYEVVEEKYSSLGAAIEKHKFILLDKETYKKFTFTFADFENSLATLEQKILQI